MNKVETKPYFKVARLETLKGKNTEHLHYKKRDCFKITLFIGQSTVEYAGKVVEVQKQALIFSNPQISYRWEHTNSTQNGFSCIFDQAFFQQYGNLNQYSIFQPEGNHIFELTDLQLHTLTEVYQGMLEEIDSDYLHKYDFLHTVVSEMIHFAMKLQH